MKKGLFLTVLFVAFTVASSFAYITIRYYNKDSKAWTFTVKVDGSTKEVTFDASKTSSVTIQCGGKTAVVTTKCGDVTITDGANIEIKDGCIKFN